MRETFGHNLEDIDVEWWNERMHPDDRRRVRKLMREAEVQNREFAAEYRFQRADGTYAEVWDRSVVIRDAAGKVIRAVGSIVDITDRKRQERALFEANERLESTVAELEAQGREIALLGELAEVMQSCVTEEEAYEVIAPFVQQLFPSHSGALSMTKASRDVLQSLCSWGDLSGREYFAPDDCWALRRGRIHFVHNAAAGLLCRHLADPPPAEYLCVPMMAKGEALGILHLASRDGGATTPRTERLATAVAEQAALSLANIRLRESLRLQSIRDQLTGLFNRRYMEESLARELSRCSRSGLPLAVLMMDIDHFKQFNDSFGHAAGDAVLRQLGEYLRSHTRGEDIVCRYGGEEIAVIFPEVSATAAFERAEQLRLGTKALEVRSQGATLGQVTMSIGIAMYPGDGDNPETLLGAADAALYRAKAGGRDQVQIAEAPSRVP
jgi:diguanylate cyclase (GGDEF)-like protein/PAS domain S-box-containing protein